MYLHGSELYKSETIDKNLNEISNIEISLNKKLLSNYEKEKLFLDYIDKTIVKLTKFSKKVVIIGPIPPALFNFQNKNSLINANHPSNYEDFKKYSEILNNKFKTLSQDNQKIYWFDPSKKLCDKVICNTGNKAGHFYGDPRHLSNYGQNFVMNEFFDNFIFTNKKDSNYKIDNL